MKLSDFLGLLDRFEAASLPYTLTRSRPDALMVSVATPNRLWEIEVCANGEIDVDEYVGGQDVREGVDAVDRVLSFWRDE